MIFRGLSTLLGHGRNLINFPSARFSTSLFYNTPFDETILEVLVCPVSKKPLRYDKEKNELVCEESGIAYPIVDGIPNLVPQDARIINKDTVDRNESPVGNKSNAYLCML